MTNLSRELWPISLKMTSWEREQIFSDGLGNVHIFDAEPVRNRPMAIYSTSPFLGPVLGKR